MPANKDKEQTVKTFVKKDSYLAWVHAPGGKITVYGSLDSIESFANIMLDPFPSHIDDILMALLTLTLNRKK